MVFGNTKVYDDVKGGWIGMYKKYKLTSETIRINGKTLYRIEALRDFGEIKKGDKGGFIEKESNLSHEDLCWVYDDAKVYGKARVYGDAQVCGFAKVYGYAEVYVDTQVYDDAMVYGFAKVWGNAEVYGDAKVGGNAVLSGNDKVYGNAVVYDNVSKLYYDVNREG